jgi:excisionase family DNA binding protein
MEQLLLSRKEAAVVLGVSVKTVLALAKRRQLTIKRIGRRALVTRRSLEEFADVGNTKEADRAAA